MMTQRSAGPLRENRLLTRAARKLRVDRAILTNRDREGAVGRCYGTTTSDHALAAERTERADTRNLLIAVLANAERHRPAACPGGKDDPHSENRQADEQKKQQLGKSYGTHRRKSSTVTLN
jgi:hypothetical protein